MRHPNLSIITLFMIIVFLVTPVCFSAEKTPEIKAQLSDKLVISGLDNIIQALNDPEKMINDKLIKSLNEKKGYAINKGSMMKTERCVGEILKSTDHLSKISTGNRVTKMEVEVYSDSKRSSMFNSSKNRTLEYTVLVITFYYDRPGVKPVKMKFEGNKYY